jgi:hypothetical protein
VDFREGTLGELVIRMNKNIHSEKYLHYVLLFLIPFILCCSSTEWMFTKLGYIDPFIYVGYGINYSDPTFHNWGYKIARLPWILYQSMAYQTFGTPYSAYFVHISCLFLAILFTYKALSRLLKPMSAFFGSALLGFLTIFHASGGADYHNTLAGPLYAISFYYFLCAIEERTQKSYIIFGVVITLTIHTNITMINLIPGLLFIWYRLQPAAFSKKNVWVVLKYCFYGALAVTLLLSLIQLSVGRTPFFFLSILKLVGTFVIDTSHQTSWWQPWSSLWFLKADFLYVLLYLITGIFSGLILGLGWVYHRSDSYAPFWTRQNILIGSYLVSFGIFLIWQTIGHTALQPEYFAYVLIVPMVVAIAGMFDQVQLSKNRALSLFLPLFFVVCFSIPLIFDTTVSRFLQEKIGNPVILVIMLWSLSFILLSFGRKLWAFLVFVPVLIGLANAEYNANDYRETTAPIAKWAKVSLIHANQMLVDKMISFRVDNKPAKSRAIYIDIKVWFQYGDMIEFSGKNVKLSDYAMSLRPTGLGDLSPPWPLKPIMDIPIEDLQKAYKKKAMIVLVTTSDQPLKDLQIRVTAMGKKLKKLEKFTVPFGPTEVPFELVTITDS